MRYLKLTLSYDGTNYNGFQRQKNAVGIQQIVEEALSHLLGENIRLVASGRTDTGVHAWGQVISFTTKSTVPIGHIPRAIKHLLPGDIVVWKAEEVPENFNARYSAVEKTYQYRIMVTDVQDPFKRNYAWEIKKQPDVEKMQKAANYLLGTHVIVINAEKVKLTGKKLVQKIYFRHSGYLGGATYTKAGELLAKNPVKMVELAVRGMIPKNRLGSQIYTKLHVYEGSEHPHEAQKPEVLEIDIR